MLGALSRGLEFNFLCCHGKRHSRNTFLAQSPFRSRLSTHRPFERLLSGRTGEIFGFATLALRRSRARRVARPESGRGAKPKRTWRRTQIHANFYSPKAAAALAESLGFAPIELGKIAEGGRLIQARALLVFRNLIKYPL
jgi:hypothetical protein